MKEKTKNLPFYKLVHLAQQGRERVISKILNQYNDSKKIDDLYMRILGESSYAINVTLKQIVSEEWEEIKIKDLKSFFWCLASELSIQHPTCTDDQICEKVKELFEGKIEVSLDKENNEVVMKVFTNIKNEKEEEKVVH